jgi:hypothetical protein
MFFKLKATSVNALTSDYEHLRPSPEAKLLQGALRLSAHVLAGDSGQFASQVLGLLAHRDLSAVQQFLNEITAGAPAYLPRASQMECELVKRVPFTFPLRVIGRNT